MKFKDMTAADYKRLEKKTANTPLSDVAKFYLHQAKGYKFMLGYKRLDKWEVWNIMQSNNWRWEQVESGDTILIAIKND